MRRIGTPEAADRHPGSGGPAPRKRRTGTPEAADRPYYWVTR